MALAYSGRIRTVSSRQNSLVKELRRAFAQGGPLDEQVCAIESVHIVEEAARSGIVFRAVFLTPEQAHRADQLLSVAAGSPEILIIPEDIFRTAVDTQAPQGVAALIETPSWNLPVLLRTPSPFLLCAVGLRDPGNLGTIVRSAEAFGAAGILLMPGTVNVWNAKAVRASAGSVFRMPHVKIRQDHLSDLRTAGLRLLATVPKGGGTLHDTDLSLPCAVLIGNEGAGLPEELVALADERITIPQKNTVESINAAVAASIVSYEAFRQRGA